MSSWLVSTPHIDLVVQAMLAYEVVAGEDPTTLGKLLWQANFDGVHYDYDGRADGDSQKAIDAYEFTALPDRIDPGVVFVAAKSLNYQSCDLPDWDTTRAYGLLHTLRAVCEERIPEYDQRFGKLEPDQIAHDPVGAWSVDDRSIYVRAELARARAGVPA